MRSWRDVAAALLDNGAVLPECHDIGLVLSQSRKNSHSAEQVSLFVEDTCPGPGATATAEEMRPGNLSSGLELGNWPAMRGRWSGAKASGDTFG